jgi:acetate kinase
VSEAAGAVLVVNCGSSSLKYELIVPASGARLAAGSVDRIGEPRSGLRHTAGTTVVEREVVAPTHQDALRRAFGCFEEVGPSVSDAGVVAVGHRVVMGGADFDRATVVDDRVVERIHALGTLAPLHNPANLAGIAAARELLPRVPHVAVFDTAFFHGLPPAAATYALDREVATKYGIRRHGAHGTSHRFVSRGVATVLGRDLADLRQIVLHLGNGASASAIRGGVPIETSMGFTPLEGLVMGTRTGDIDPAVVVYLARDAGMSLDEIDDLLNTRSGLQGLSGHGDMRDVHRLVDAGDAAARLALDVYVHRLRKYIGAYVAVLGGLDALAFTAGVGENDAVVRAEAVAGLGFLGIEIDPKRNTGAADGARVISPARAAVSVLVVPTDEELAIAEETLAAIG